MHTVSTAYAAHTGAGSTIFLSFISQVVLQAQIAIQITDERTLNKMEIFEVLLHELHGTGELHGYTAAC